MSDTPYPAPEADPAGLGPLRPDAVSLQGVTRRGRPCTLVDNTGEHLPGDELQAILDALIDQEQFGFALTTAAGGATLDLARPETAHVQIAGRLYRMFLHRYTARIEPF
jgi:hypothetical protein